MFYREFSQQQMSQLSIRTMLQFRRIGEELQKEIGFNRSKVSSLGNVLPAAWGKS